MPVTKKGKQNLGWTVWVKKVKGAKTGTVWEMGEGMGINQKKPDYQDLRWGSRTLACDLPG